MFLDSFSQEVKVNGFLQGPVGPLEVQLTWPQMGEVPFGVAVICHPHPLHGGTMHNKVVSMLAKALDEQGFATVRFNYRGVGQSVGQYGEMFGEIEDLLAVIAWTRQVLPEEWPLVLAGFSFGAYISASVARQQKIHRLITVAPAVNHADFTALVPMACPWLVVQGDQDEVVPCAEVESFVQHATSPIDLVVLSQVGHFFHGHLTELKQVVTDWLSK